MNDFLSRSSLLWLLAALVSAIFIHIEHLPFWIVLGGFFTMGWRFMVYLGRVSVANRWIKALLVFGCAAGVFLTYGQSYSLETMVALFAVGTVLKPLEIADKRDTYILIFLCYFLCALQFLFDQSPHSAIIVLISYLIAATAQISLNLNLSGSATLNSKALAPKLAGKIMLQAIPLAIILFIFVPRVAPLWSLKIKTQAAQTGLSNSMTPGDIAKLSKNDDLAFIATFDKKIPENKDLYWRALVLDEFDGTTWSASKYQKKVTWYSDSQSLVDDLGNSLSQYSVLVEPHDNTWLFALDRAIANYKDTGITNELTLVSRQPIHTKTQYRAASDLSAEQDTSLLDRVDRLSLIRLPNPNNDNPETKQLSEQLLRISRSEQDYIKAVRDYFLSKPYTYTLNPSLLGQQNTIDHFLFETLEGFCAHYAGAFTYLMRLAGIPARVVIGYQGGEVNEDGNYLAVYQYNAHAWVELWLDGEGWVRFDPTTYVAPERVEQGIELALEEEFGQRSVFSTRNWGVINDLRLQLQNLNYLWHSWVLSYDQEKQQNLIQNWFGYVSILEYGLILFAIIISLIALLSAWFWFQQRPEKEESIIQEYRRLIKLLTSSGVEYSASQAPSTVINKAVEHFPEAKDDLQYIGKLLELYLYTGKENAFGKPEKRILKQRITRIATKLKSIKQ